MTTPTTHGVFFLAYLYYDDGMPSSGGLFLFFIYNEPSSSFQKYMLTNITDVHRSGDELEKKDDEIEEFTVDADVDMDDIEVDMDAINMTGGDVDSAAVGIVVPPVPVPAIPAAVGFVAVPVPVAALAGTTTNSKDVDLPLMGSSRTSGGFIRGLAHGNIPNHADFTTPSLDLEINVNGEVYLYLTEQYPRDVKFEDLKGDSELVVIVKVVGSMGPILEKVARKCSIIQSECVCCMF